MCAPSDSRLNSTIDFHYSHNQIRIAQKNAMVKKIPTHRPASHVSSAAAPSKSMSTHNGNSNKSSILRSAFSPSRFQLSLFASVIQGLDSQHLRIHDTNTGRLRCEHALGSRASISCLNWGHYHTGYGDLLEQPSKKKRKRSEDTCINGSESTQSDVVLALGTSESEIHMFSPTEAKIVGTLRGTHAQGIRDFKFAWREGSREGWSLGGDGSLVQWDLRRGTRIRYYSNYSKQTRKARLTISNRTLSIPTTSATTLLPCGSSVLCASHMVYLMNPDIPGDTRTFQASKTPIHTLIASPLNSSQIPFAFLAGAEAETFINVLSVTSGDLLGSLVAGNEVESLTSCAQDTGKLQITDNTEGNDIVAAVTRDGIVELFLSPFNFEDSTIPKKTASIKLKRQHMVHKPAASVRFVRPDKSNTPVPILGASFEGNDIILVWVEGGMELVFERLRWRNEQTGELEFTGLKEVVKARSVVGLGTLATNQVKVIGRSQVDESHTVVETGGATEGPQTVGAAPEIIDISSAEEDSEPDEDFTSPVVPPPDAVTNGDTIADITMEDANSGVNEEVVPTEEQSFGDLIRASAHGTVDVAAAFTDPDEQALAPPIERNLQLPSGMSLGTVLTQALRTNDVNLLETCLHVDDLNMIRATIERLNSSLATALLQKLAERLHSRPGRAGSLMVWVQWTLVAHGGYLVGQPDVVKKLTSLYRVVKERANSLPSLLSLKGKLDMLEAQMNLRKSMQRRFGGDDPENEDDEEAVIYVEGQEESSSQEDSDDQIDSIEPSQHKDKRRSSLKSPANDVSSGSDEDMDDMPTTMDDPEDVSDDDASEPLIDQEASETDDDSGDDASEEEVDFDDVDSMDEDDDEGLETQRSPKKQRPNAKLSNGYISRKS